MKNSKGFTLVELLVVIVIIGVITMMAWPMISRMQNDNKADQYKKYGEAMISAAKLYVDSYEEDIFRYEDDLTELEREQGQCAFITFQDLKSNSLIKDFDYNEISCNSDSTFVRVTRKDGKYKYKYFLGCGNKKSGGAKLSDSDIYYTLPKENTLNRMDAENCTVDE